eukprot:12862518-Alexandrium_andersonii.AAC.1
MEIDDVLDQISRVRQIDTTYRSDMWDMQRRGMMLLMWRARRWARGQNIVGARCAPQWQDAYRASEQAKRERDCLLYTSPSPRD